MKKVRFLFVSVLFSVMFMSSVKAFPSSITLDTAIDHLTLDLDNNLTVTSEVDKTEATYPWILVKAGSSKNLIGLSESSNVEVPPNTVCTLENGWVGSKDSLAIAYIIDLFEGVEGNSFSTLDRYYYQEILTRGYTGNLTATSGTPLYDYIMSTNTKLLGTKSWNEIISTARTISNKDTSSAEIKVNDLKELTLSFTLNDDGYYESSEVIITSNVDYTLGDLTNNKFTYEKDGDKYIFKIKSEDVGSTAETFTSTTSVSKTYTTSAKYNCQGHGSLVLVSTEDVTTRDSIKINGKVEKDKFSIVISGIDSKGKKVKGIKFELRTKEQKEADEEGTIKETNGESSLAFDSLIEGEYYLREVEVPEGYSLDDKEYKIVIDKDGKITVDGKSQDTSLIKITAKLNGEDTSTTGADTEVEVDDAFLPKSTLLIAIAMFDIALGIGIVLYVKKNNTH